MVYRPSADRAEYAAQSEEERRKTRERQRRPDGSFYGSDTADGAPPVEIVNRDIEAFRTQIEQRQTEADPTDTLGNPLGNPLGLPTPGATADDTSSWNTGQGLDIEANWSDRRWLIYDEARADAEGTDLGEVYARVTADRDPGARGDEDAARFSGYNQALARETIDDWKNRIRFAEEYAANVPLGQVADATDPRRTPPVAPKPETTTATIIDPATGMSRTIRIDGVYKAEETPTAEALAASLRAAGQDDMVFLGWEGDYGAGQSRVSPLLMKMEDLKYFDNLEKSMQDRVFAITRAYYEGMDPQFSWNEKRWNEAIAIANNALISRGVYKSVFEAYEGSLARWRAGEDNKKRTSGGGSGSYGFGGGGSASTKRITLTSPTDALYLLNQAMAQYLGRRATTSELSQFIKMLNTQERANPVVATAAGDTTTQEGGFNPATFAEQFARGMEGSAEYQTATTFLDALMGAMSEGTGVI